MVKALPMWPIWMPCHCRDRGASAIPGEEFVDLARRHELRIAGRISKLSGKQELIARGLFKDIRVVVATHAAFLFLQSCAFLREGFQEDKHISIHPVVKLKENQSVNIIPDFARVETYVCAVERSNGYDPFKADLKIHEQVGKSAAKLGFVPQSRFPDY